MKLRVEHLANIQNAEIETKNLTLFVGQNSTHKSYMAHVIYELYKEIAKLKNEYSAVSRLVYIVYKKILQNRSEELNYILSLKRELSEETHRHRVDVDEWEDEEFTIVKIFFDPEDQDVLKFFKLIYELVLQELAEKVDKSFNVDRKIIQSLFIESQKELFGNGHIAMGFSTPLAHFEEEQEEIGDRVINSIVRQVIETLLNELNNYYTAYYFPASRTGFVLTLDEIYAGIFRDKFRGQVSATRLGEPTIDFIQTFADIKTGKVAGTVRYWQPSLFSSQQNQPKSIKLIKFLEKEIIKGQIKEVRSDQDYTSYYLDIQGKKLDLHLASSATLETLPFIVFLKNTKNIENTFFVIEEPEAHLHPKAQVQMAKFIVLLSKIGAKVLVTTHSDYILNEINNCIKRYAIDDTDEFAISKDNVSAYLFKNENDKTVVNSLEIDHFGIANDNFDEVLEELIEMSNELNEKILDND